MSDNKRKGNLLSAAELAAKNLAQIQKIDPCASKILDKVTHSALYKFNISKNQWEKTDVDGTMFIYQRVDRPLFSLMIANRQSPSDFIEPITANLKINNDEQYIFFCKADGTINGLWFYDKKDSSRIYKLIEKLIEKLNKSAEAAAKADTPVVQDKRSAQLLDLIRGGQHNSIKQPATPQKIEESPTKSSETVASISPPKSLSFNPDAANSSKTAKPLSEVNTMPVLLQKLMIQEQPRNILKEPGTAMSSDELEKDLLRTAKPRNALLQEFGNSPSAISLAAVSTRSVHGSEGEADLDIAEGESLAPLEPSFIVGSGSTTPVLSKDQFLSAITHLLQTDDQFVRQVHQAYVDAINRRLRVD